MHRAPPFFPSSQPAPCSPAILMKRWEKMESWMGSTWRPAGHSPPDPTEMQMSPRWVTDAVQPGSTRMVLGAGKQRLGSLLQDQVIYTCLLRGQQPLSPLHRGKEDQRRLPRPRAEQAPSQKP